jgi:hypothetical protein
LEQLIRVALRAKKTTVPKEKVAYVLNRPKGEFGSSLRKLALEFPQIPDVLRYKIVFARSRQPWVRKGIATAVRRLAKTRERLEHELHAASRSEHSRRETGLVRGEMREVEMELNDIVHKYL